MRPIKTIVLVLLTGFALPLHALHADDFTTGSKAYEAGRYAEATEAFQASLEQEETAALRHNLALSLYQQGRPAEAVWQLERALQLQPFSQNYRFKLGALRQQMGLYQPDNPWWLSAAQILNFGAWVWIAGLSFWLLLAAFALPRIAGKHRRLVGKLVVSLSSVFLLLSLAAITLQKTNEITGIVVADAPTPLRHAPASAAPEAGQARPGERARQIDQHRNFLKIKTESNFTGWIQANLLKKL